VELYRIRACDAETACAGGQTDWFSTAVIVDEQVQAQDWCGATPRVRHRREVTFDRETGAFMITELFAGVGRHEIEVGFAGPCAEARAGLSERAALRLAEVARQAPWARAGFDLSRVVELGPARSPLAVLVPFANQGLDLELRPTLRYLLRVSLPCVLNLAVVPFERKRHEPVRH
jgi:hypothetical protein